MKNCIYCSAELLDHGYFCKSCGQQTTCKVCNELLEQDASYCSICGSQVGAGPSENGSHDAIIRSQLLNTFEFKETRSERTAKAVLTDQSVDNLKETLSLVVSGYPLGNIIKPNGRKKRDELSGDLFPDVFAENGESIEVPVKNIPSVGNETSERIKHLFYQDGDKLILEKQDLKASGPKDAGIRLIYLRMLYAKEIERADFVLRDDLNATVKEVMGTLDPNVVNWITTTNDLSLKEEGGKTYARLKGDGYNKAIDVLAQTYNDELKGDFILEKKIKNSAKSKSSKSDRSSNTTKISNKTKTGTVAEGWIKNWQEMALNIDLQGIARDLSQLNRVVLALWLIHKSTNGKVDVAGTSKIEPIITRLFFMPGKRQNLEQALKNGYKDMLLKTPDGWRITPAGIKLAQGFVENFSTSKPKPTK